MEIYKQVIQILSKLDTEALETYYNMEDDVTLKSLVQAELEERKRVERDRIQAEIEDYEKMMGFEFNVPSILSNKAQLDAFIHYLENYRKLMWGEK